MRVCVIYDCLFPYTVGGAERWNRALAQRLAADGHEVTYVTLRQWDRGTTPDVPGVRVVAVGPRMGLYTDGGRRRIVPPLVFGAGVLWHLLVRGRRYDAVHSGAFPYFSLLAAGLVAPLHRYRLAVDWFEVWSRDYWRGYLGGVGGRVGELVQGLCARVRQHAFCFSDLHARRLREIGLRSQPQILAGIYDGPTEPRPPAPVTPHVVFAGRHIPEKRAPAVVGAVVAAARTVPGLRATVFGDGPDRPAVLAEIARLGAAAVVDAPGFVDSAVVDEALRGALCMVLPSSREGYGLIVVEAAAAGTPSVVVAGPDNAAVELIEDGVNGIVARSAAADDLAAAIVRVHEGGAALRESTTRWFAANAPRLSLAGSLEAVLAGYGDATPSARR
jgi:glycosyltransferase involved in cell wall biosynthesis